MTSESLCSDWIKEFANTVCRVVITSAIGLVLANISCQIANSYRTSRERARCRARQGDESLERPAIRQIIPLYFAGAPICVCGHFLLRSCIVFKIRWLHVNTFYNISPSFTKYTFWRFFKCLLAHERHEMAKAGCIIETDCHSKG